MSFYLMYFATVVPLFVGLYFFRKTEYYKKLKSKHAMKYGKAAFWIWIGYQTIKGMITTSLIWAPLIYHTFWDK